MFAPVARIETFRLLFGLAAGNGWEIVLGRENIVLTWGINGRCVCISA